MKTIRIALAQINPTVGDFQGNCKKIIEYVKAAAARGAGVVAFPELCITGYPPEDLLLKPKFIQDNLDALDEISRHTENIAVVAGFVDRKDDIYNAAALLYRGRVVDVYHKAYLPNYGVFDEMRYFQAGAAFPVYDLGGVRVGVNICEDVWYPEGPVHGQSVAGAELLININASPYGQGKAEFRRTMLSTRATDNAVFIAYVNMVGGQDELVFDGQSMVINPAGEVVGRAAQFKEDMLVMDIDIESVFLARLHDPRRRIKVKSAQAADIRHVLVRGVKTENPGEDGRGQPEIKENLAPAMDPVEEVFHALVTGTRDYFAKNGFKSAVIGLSGGIDSSLVAALAVEALGPVQVTGIAMPSVYTSDESKEDAAALTRNLGIRLYEVSIDPVFDVYRHTLAPLFSGLGEDAAEENLQARIRGNILMAVSNKFGSLVLATGNKSEMSVGYATLYGDMAGGFAMLKDVPKTLVYGLAGWINRRNAKPVIPERVLVKEPTAELRHNQKDSDSLPPYPVLDPILMDYIERDMSSDEIIAAGRDPETVRRVLNMVDKNEYKRRQSPPGIKITRRAFGKDRRFPITNKYRSC
jgi:NAD+ synthase (glutamine-hydrolysing)